MNGTTISYLAIVIFSSIAHGAETESFCDENNWHIVNCIQSLQENILQLREQVTDQAAQLSIQSLQLNETQNSLKNLQNNSVPIGFIYVQLSEQPEPHHLWPNMTWSDISVQYAGLFFRVLGGDSAQFNVTQEESSPRISRAESFNTGRRHNITMPSNGWSLGLSTGSPPGLFVSWWGVRFFQTVDELRPRNKAVRIWKRIN